MIDDSRSSLSEAKKSPVSIAFPFERELPLKIPNIALPIVLLIIPAGSIVFGWLPSIGHYPHLAGALVGVLLLRVFRKHHELL